MTDGTRVLRTVAVPVAIALIFLVFTPRLCTKAIVSARKQKPVAAAPTQTGLSISSSTPAPKRVGTLRFPPGLDGARVEYLVEIDQTFAQPLTMEATADAPVTAALLERGYVEKRADGTIVPTHEGLINVNGAMQSANSWTVPIAQRKFVGLDTIEDTGDGRYVASMRWRWEPTPVGSVLIPKPQDHRVKAELAGGERNWVLARWVTEVDREPR